MTVRHSNKQKPSKPYPEYPLYAGSNGQWCRRIKGKLYSFGQWDDPTTALKKHNDQYPFLKEGINPPDSFDGWRVGDLVNEFLSVQEDRLKTGEIGQAYFDGLQYVGKLIVEYIPRLKAVEALRPDDFRKLRTGMMKRFQPSNTRVNISRARSFFKFAFEEQLISKPVFYGRGFDAPAKALVRKARNAKPKKLFIPEQVHCLLANASPTLKAMIMLSINVGMNNADLGNLKATHIDSESGWMDYPRHKTGIQRRAKLWPETLQALAEYQEVRQRPLVQFSKYLFITKARRKWEHSSLPSEFRKLLDFINESNRKAIIKAAEKEGIEPPDDIPDIFPHGSFGYFRHIFETVAGGSRDQVAVNAIMGHVDDSMAAEYRESIEDERLVAVAAHVRKWLYGERVAE